MKKNVTFTYVEYSPEQLEIIKKIAQDMAPALKSLADK